MAKPYKVLIFLFAPLLFGCEGPTGPAGSDGADGSDGSDGSDGAANVQSHTFTINQNRFTGSGQTEWYYIDLDLIDQQVMQSGMVLSYTDIGTGGDAWFAMPLVLPLNSFYTVNLTFGYTEGEYFLQIVKSFEESVAESFHGHQIKVIIVPPELSGTNAVERFHPGQDQIPFNAEGL